MCSRPLFVLALAVALAAPAAARAQATHPYSVIFHGQLSGKQTTRVGADGRITVDFSYRDNGRGPDVKEEIALLPDGTQRSHRLTGKSTFGAPIDESFTRWSGPGAVAQPGRPGPGHRSRSRAYIARSARARPRGSPSWCGP